MPKAPRKPDPQFPEIITHIANRVKRGPRYADTRVHLAGVRYRRRKAYAKRLGLKPPKWIYNTHSRANKVRVLICGSRNWTDYLTILQALKGVRNVECVIEGEAQGADLLGRRAAEELGILVHPFPARWATEGKAAGALRNTRMLLEGKPDLVLAFPLGDSRGTWNMVRKARAAGVEVRVIPPHSI